MTFYPEKISRRFYARENVGTPPGVNAVGTGAGFLCGSFVRFYLRIDPVTKEIGGAKFKSNGCGYAVAAADVLAEKITGRKLTGLAGLDRDALREQIERELGRFEPARGHCPEICLDALEAAFADFRAFQLEEFQGEKALICTCFGVAEDTVEEAIVAGGCETVGEVGEFCHAGTGCGSCQFLIQELLDVYRTENI
jgi:NifU-like protein